MTRDIGNYALPERSGHARGFGRPGRTCSRARRIRSSRTSPAAELCGLGETATCRGFAGAALAQPGGGGGQRWAGRAGSAHLESVGDSIERGGRMPINSAAAGRCAGLGAGISDRLGGASCRTGDRPRRPRRCSRCGGPGVRPRGLRCGQQRDDAFTEPFEFAGLRLACRPPVVFRKRCRPALGRDRRRAGRHRQTCRRPGTRRSPGPAERDTTAYR